ncbi:hypothetical protein D3C87_1775080 [compost metagenome]
MHDPDALDHLANVRGLGWIRETLSDVPLRKGCQTLLQRIDGELVGVLRQVANDAYAGRGQVPTPSHLEVLDCRPVAFTGVFPSAGAEIPICLFHPISPSKTEHLRLHTPSGGFPGAT